MEEQVRYQGRNRRGEDFLAYSMLWQEYRLTEQTLKKNSELDKMRRLNEIVSGQRATPTPQYDPTMVYSIQQTSTAMAEVPAGPAAEEASPTPLSTATAVSSGNAGGEAPAAEADPFNTGIQITTDPNAVPMLDLPPAPMPTPRPDISTTGSSLDDAFSDEGFGFGIPDNFFDEEW